MQLSRNSSSGFLCRGFENLRTPRLADMSALDWHFKWLFWITQVFMHETVILPTRNVPMLLHNDSQTDKAQRKTFYNLHISSSASTERYFKLILFALLIARCTFIFKEKYHFLSNIGRNKQYEEAQHISSNEAATENQSSASWQVNRHVRNRHSKTRESGD